jgi:hypothetical protein
MKTEYYGVKTYIADMESCGVYFTDEQKDVLEKEREDNICKYSGLPSLLTYIENQTHERNKV